MSKFSFCSFVANSCHKCSKGKLGRKIFFTKEYTCWFFVPSLVDLVGKEKFLSFYHYLDRINQKIFYFKMKGVGSCLSVCIMCLFVMIVIREMDGSIAIWLCRRRTIIWRRVCVC